MLKNQYEKFVLELATQEYDGLINQCLTALKFGFEVF